MIKEKVSIVVPLRNEESSIENFIKSLKNQINVNFEYEFIFIDGNSKDKTLNKLKKNLIGFSYKYKILVNKDGTTPKSLNKGIKNSNGDYILRMDCHSIYPRNYILSLIKNQKKYNCENIGGIVKTIPKNNSLISHAIAAAMSSVFCVGPSKFRISESLKNKKIISVDTVPFGCYKKTIFKKIGLFNEKLLRNQDDEFNSRIITNGGEILLDKSIVIKYEGRETFSKLFITFYQYGLYKPLAAIIAGKVYTLRQLIPLFSFLVLLILISSTFFYSVSIFLVLSLIISYIILSFVFGYKSLKSKNFKNYQKIYTFQFLFLLSALIIHSSYAFGYLLGLIKSLLNFYDNKDISISR